MSTLVHVSSPPMALTSKGKSAPLNNAFAYHDMSQNADMYYVYFSFNVHILRLFMKKQERVCSLKDRLWGRVIYCINLIFLVSKIRKISSRVDLKIF